MNVDKIIKSAIKEILHLPSDSVLYSPRKMKGLGIFRIEWEVTLQHLHICRLLYKSANTYITEIRNLEEEQKTCINKLQLTNIVDAHLKLPREIA